MIIDKLCNSEPFVTTKKIWRNLPHIIPFNKRVGYIGWAGHGNLGDEAMYFAFRKLFNGLTILPFRYKEKTRKVELLEYIMKRKLFDAIILGGGTLINSEGWLQYLNAAQRCCDKSYVFGTGVRDPICWDNIDKDNSSPDEWIEYLKKCSFIGVRGPLSKKILNDKGLYDIQITGDPALFFGKDKINFKKSEKKLGINIGFSEGKLWGNEEKVINFIVKVAKIMISKGWTISFLPVWDKDIPPIEEAIKRLRKPVSIFYKYKSIKKTIDFLENCDLFIGEKLHSVILAMCAYTPSIMLEYRPKCLDFMTSMGLEDFNMRTDELEIEKLMSMIDELMEKTVYYQEKMFADISYYKRALCNARNNILESIIE